MEKDLLAGCESAKKTKRIPGISPFFGERKWFGPRIVRNEENLEPVRTIISRRRPYLSLYHLKCIDLHEGTAYRILTHYL